MGLVPAREGQVAWEGRSLTGLRPHQRVRAGIAYVPQGREIFPRLTVEENLYMGAFFIDSKQEQQSLIEEVYELFPRLRERMHQRAGTMSGGEQQMLAIGRALMSKPASAAARRAVAGPGATHHQADLRHHPQHPQRRA